MFTAIEFLAVVTSGLFGIIQARQYRLDLLGVFVFAFAMAFGGGTLRDLMLDRHPLFWIEQAHYPVIIFVMALLSFWVPRFHDHFQTALHLPDALGLALFTVVGAQFALDGGTSYFVAALFGVVTGTFGGVICDVLSNEVPKLFRATTPLFATCSFLGCWVYFGVQAVTSDWLANESTLAVIVAILFITLFRLAAIRWKWSLPEAKDGPETEVPENVESK